LTSKADPLARVRALIHAVDVDGPNPFDTFRQSFGTAEPRLSTREPTELLGFDSLDSFDTLRRQT
jgi:hypothetical protein